MIECDPWIEEGVEKDDDDAKKSTKKAKKDK